MPNTRCMLLLWATAVLLFVPAGVQGGEPSNPENELCLTCHGTAGFARGRADGTPRSLFVAAAAYAASVHGAAMRCIDCHVDLGGIPHANVSQTRLEWRQNSVDLCVGCHIDAGKDYAGSVHGRQLLQGNAAAASCADCHAAHSVARTQDARLALGSACSNCHGAQSRSYTQTHHGKVAALGYADTATCSDCHGSHAVLSAGDRASRVSTANRLATCRSCHEDATPGFASFQPHASTDDFARYPVMWVTSKLLFALVVGALGFFWLHSALWFYREYRDRRVRKLRPHILSQALPPEGPQVRRWSAMWRVMHLAFALSVIALVATSVALLYPNAAWAPVLERALGGPGIASALHRSSAVIMVALFVAHLVYVALHLGRNWNSFKVFGAYSLMPNWQDARDFLAMFKWFFGRGPRPASDHWNYMQKVDYWAPFWGIAMLTLTGAMLWFKALTAQFLPGWSFNVATLVHGEEALLAAVYLFTIHYFSTHWRPDKFPLDVVMFTGSMPLEEFRRDYALEYDRLVAGGQLQRYLVEAPSRPMTLGSRILGFGLVAIGLVLLVLIAHGSLVNLLAGS